MFPFWSFYTEQFSILTGLNVPSSAFKLSSRMCLCIINVHLRNEQPNNASCWCSFAKSLMTIFPSTYCNSHFYSCTTQCSAPCLWVLQKIATRLPTWTTANHRFVVSSNKSSETLLYGGKLLFNTVVFFWVCAHHLTVDHTSVCVQACMWGACICMYMCCMLEYALICGLYSNYNSLCKATF